MLVHERPALPGRDHHLAGAGLAMAAAVLAGLVDVEVVMRVLDGRDGDAARRPASGSSRVRSVVLPLPLQPASPKMRIGRASLTSRGSVSPPYRPARRPGHVREAGAEIVVAGHQVSSAGDPQQHLADQPHAASTAGPASPTSRTADRAPSACRSSIWRAARPARAPEPGEMLAQARDQDLAAENDQRRQDRQRRDAPASPPA